MAPLPPTTYNLIILQGLLPLVAVAPSQYSAQYFNYSDPILYLDLSQATNRTAIIVDLVPTDLSCRFVSRLQAIYPDKFGSHRTKW